MENFAPFAVYPFAQATVAFVWQVAPELAVTDAAFGTVDGMQSTVHKLLVTVRDRTIHYTLVGIYW